MIPWINSIVLGCSLGWTLISLRTLRDGGNPEFPIAFAVVMLVLGLGVPT